MSKKKVVRTAKSGLKVVGGSISPQLYKKVQDLIKEGRYVNQSDLIRTAIKLLVQEEEDKKNFIIRKSSQ